MSLFAYDTFAGTAGDDLLDRTGQLGAAYARHPSAGSASSFRWELSSAGRAYCPSASYTPAHYLISGVSSSADYDVVADWRFLTYLSDSSVGITFRHDATANTGYRLVYDSHTSFRRWSLILRVAGSDTTLGTYSIAPGTGVDVAVRVELRSSGNRIVCKFGGVSQITSTDATITAAGRVGLFSAADSGATETTGLHLDRIAVGSAGQVMPDYDITGVASGPPHAPQTYTATLATGVNPGSVTITPATAGLSGTFSPTSFALADAARSATFTFTPSAAGTATISATDSAALVDPPSLTFVVGYFAPARLAFWESRIHDKHATGGQPYVAGESFWLSGSEHYDVIQCFMAARDYSVDEDIPPTDWSVEIAAAVTRYRDRCVIEAGSMPPFEIFTRGLARQWLETGVETNRTAINLIRPATGDATEYAIYNFAAANFRPTALLLMACLDREVCGMTPCPLTDAAARSSLDQIMQITAPPGSYYALHCKFFMLSLVLRTLIAYRNLYLGASNDATRQAIVDEIPQAVEDACDFIWAEGWLPEYQALNYIDVAATDPSLDWVATMNMVSSANTTHFVGPPELSTVDDYYRSGYLDIAGVFHVITDYVGSTRTFTIYPASGALGPGNPFQIRSNITGEITDAPGPAEELNQMAAPAFAWAYWYRASELGDVAGAVRHRERHDALFNGATMSRAAATTTQKQWNQSLLWSEDGLANRALGDAASSASLPAASILFLGPPGGPYLMISQAS